MVLQEKEKEEGDTFVEERTGIVRRVDVVKGTGPPVFRPASDLVSPYTHRREIPAGAFR